MADHVAALIGDTSTDVDRDVTIPVQRTKYQLNETLVKELSGALTGDRLAALNASTLARTMVEEAVSQLSALVGRDAKT
jgi:hypothetical protein